MEEVAVTEERFSIICPLGRKKIEVAVRGRQCAHGQCFDRNTWLEFERTKRGQRTSSCPVCQIHIVESDLVEDTEFLRSLHSVNPEVEREIPILVHEGSDGREPASTNLEPPMYEGSTWGASREHTSTPTKPEPSVYEGSTWRTNAASHERALTPTKLEPPASEGNDTRERTPTSTKLEPRSSQPISAAVPPLNKRPPPRGKRERSRVMTRDVGAVSYVDLTGCVDAPSLVGTPQAAYVDLTGGSSDEPRAAPPNDVAPHSSAVPLSDEHRTTSSDVVPRSAAVSLSAAAVPLSGDERHAAPPSGAATHSSAVPLKDERRATASDVAPRSSTVLHHDGRRVAPPSGAAPHISAVPLNGEWRTISSDVAPRSSTVLHYDERPRDAAPHISAVPLKDERPSDAAPHISAVPLKDERPSGAAPHISAVPLSGARADRREKKKPAKPEEIFEELLYARQISALKDRPVVGAHSKVRIRWNTDKSIHAHFPFLEPNAAQIALGQRIVAALNNKRHTLLESPTGTGKSAALLCSVLSWQRQQDTPVKVFYCTHTHNQIKQVVKDLRNTAYRPSMAILGSQERFCVNEEVKGGGATSRFPRRGRQAVVVHSSDGDSEEDTLYDKCRQRCKEALLQMDPSRPKPREGHAKPTCAHYVGLTTREHVNHVHSNMRPSDFSEGSSHGIWDIEDIKQGAVGCPHFTARVLAKNAELVFCPYNYLTDPIIQRGMQLSFQDAVVVVDEAHNIDGTFREAGTIDASLSQIKNAEATLEKLSIYDNIQRLDVSLSLQRFVERLRAFVCRQYEPLRKFAKTGGDDYHLQRFAGTANESHKVLNHLFPPNETASSADVLLAGVDRLMSALAETKFGSHVPVGLRHLEEWLVKFKIFSKYPRDYTTLVLSRSAKPNLKAIACDRCCVHGPECDAELGHRQLVFSLVLNCAAPLMNPLSDACHSIILTSGTLAPMEGYTYELGPRFYARCGKDGTHEALHVIDMDRQLYVAAIAKSPSGRPLVGKFKYYEQEKIKYCNDIAESIIKLVPAIPDGVLVFFSSYSFLKFFATHCLSRLQSFLDKVILVETSEGDASTVKQQYYTAVDSGRGGLLLAVFRAKMSEGVSFNDKYARGVIAVGIPNLYFNSVTVQEKQRHNSHQCWQTAALSGKEWYKLEGFRALNQALGRCIRHRHDYGVLLMLDQRMTESDSQSKISRWLRSSIQSPKSVDEAVLCVQALFERMAAVTANGAPSSTGPVSDASQSAQGDPGVRQYEAGEPLRGPKVEPVVVQYEAVQPRRAPKAEPAVVQYDAADGLLGPNVAQYEGPLKREAVKAESPYERGCALKFEPAHTSGAAMTSPAETAGVKAESSDVRFGVNAESTAVCVNVKAVSTAVCDGTESTALRYRVKAESTTVCEGVKVESNAVRNAAQKKLEPDGSIRGGAELEAAASMGGRVGGKLESAASTVSTGQCFRVSTTTTTTSTTTASTAAATATTSTTSTTATLASATASPLRSDAGHSDGPNCCPSPGTTSQTGTSATQTACATPPLRYDGPHCCSSPGGLCTPTSQTGTSASQTACATTPLRENGPHCCSSPGVWTTNSPTGTSASQTAHQHQACASRDMETAAFVMLERTSSSSSSSSTSSSSQSQHPWPLPRHHLCATPAGCVGDGGGVGGVVGRVGCLDGVGGGVDGKPVSEPHRCDGSGHKKRKHRGESFYHDGSSGSSDSCGIGGGGFGGIGGGGIASSGGDTSSYAEDDIVFYTPPTSTPSLDGEVVTTPPPLPLQPSSLCHSLGSHTRARVPLLDRHTHSVLDSHARPTPLLDSTSLTPLVHRLLSLDAAELQRRQRQGEDTRVRSAPPPSALHPQTRSFREANSGEDECVHNRAATHSATNTAAALSGAVLDQAALDFSRRLRREGSERSGEGTQSDLDLAQAGVDSSSPTLRLLREGSERSGEGTQSNLDLAQAGVDSSSPTLHLLRELSKDSECVRSSEVVRAYLLLDRAAMEVSSPTQRLRQELSEESECAGSREATQIASGLARGVVEYPRPTMLFRRREEGSEESEYTNSNGEVAGKVDLMGACGLQGEDSQDMDTGEDAPQGVTPVCSPPRLSDASEIELE